MQNCEYVYNRYKYFPIKITVVYILFTFLLSIIGPAKYPGNGYNVGLVVPFIVGVIICLLIGYYFGIHTKSAKPIKKYQEGIDLRNERLLKVTLAVSLMSVVLEFGYVLSTGHFSLSINNLGNLYITDIDMDNNNYLIMFRFLSSPCRFIALSLGLLYFTQFSKKYRLLVTANVVIYILIFLFGYGNQKGVSDIAIYIATAVFVTRAKKGKKSNRRTVFLIGIGAIFVFILFSYMQYLRYVPRGINASNYHLFSTGDFYYDTNHLIFKIFGDDLGFGMASILNGYLSQGYYGLSLCLQLPFVWSYGIGSSYALISLFNRFGISGIFERTYLFRMQEHYVRHGLRSWNTIFPWLASDYTWIGAMLFFIIIGYLMAKTWKEVLLYENSISYLLFVCIVILVVFIPANNQLFHGYDSFIATWTIILMWVFVRRRFSYE